MVPLESSKLFIGLPPAEVERAGKAARLVQFKSGETVFREGDFGDGIYLVSEGIIQISTLVGQGDRRVFSHVSPGEIFGEMSVMDNDVRSATATAGEDTTAYFIPRADMLDMLQRSPQLSVSLVKEISRRLREFNRQYIREVIQSERLALVGRFTRSIVHDLKNPLNIIGIAADMAGMETASLETRASAKVRIRKQVDRISIMVNELLEFTRGTQTSFVLALSDYQTFINTLVEELRAETAIKSVSVELEGEPPPVKVAINPQRLSRVFYNLAHNATDAMPGGGKIRLRFHLTAKEVVTEIEDGGPGIADEVIEHLFEAFVTHGKAHGTGLGLSICKRIVEDHQGHISARNSPGGGAIFSFTLPIQKG